MLIPKRVKIFVLIPEKDTMLQVSIDNTTNRTRHVETTHRSNSTVGSTGHEVAAIATTVNAERAHSSIKQKEAQADVVEKKKEKSFNKQVSLTFHASFQIFFFLIVASQLARSLALKNTDDITSDL